MTTGRSTGRVCSSIRTWRHEAQALAGSTAIWASSNSPWRSDGFRRNSGQDDDIGNAFVQLELTPETSVQGEYRYRNATRGDLRLRFFPDDVLPDEPNKEERHTMRFGARHTFSPNSIFLGSFTYQNARFAVKEEQLGGVFPSLNARRPENAVIGELQHLFRSQYFNLTAGAGYAKIDGHIDAAVGTIFPPPLDIIPLPRTPTNLKHTNVYAYSYINVLKNVTFTLGASGDIATGDNPDFNDTRQFNPKFGITWNPL